MAYGHLDEVCAPKRKKDDERFYRRVIRYHTAVAHLSFLYRYGDISLYTWYTAESLVAKRYRMTEYSIYRIWEPDVQHRFKEERAMRRLYIQNKNTDRTER